MNDIARLNLVLAVTVFAFAGIIFLSWPEPLQTAHSALASPYCADKSISPDMQAKAGFALDVRTGETIYASNEMIPLPLASLTKLMSVYTALQVLESEDRITITREAMLPEGNGLSLGEVWRTEDLADYTLVSSVNDGARALALAAAEKAGETYERFIERMNENAQTMGLVQTFFSNETGLDISESMGSSYGSAKDMAAMIAYMHAHAPRMLEPTTKQRMLFTAISGQEHDAKNTSMLIGTLGGAMGAKTGFTDIAGGNLAIVYEPIPGNPVAAVVLGSTREGRDEDMRALTDEIRKWATKRSLCSGKSI
jgi:D-alanyl-D-alanine carboxypeptidase (penicillin-binding protein 5/6)